MTPRPRGLLIPLFLACVLIPSARASAGDELILCGGDEVFALRAGEPGKFPTEKVWSWRAKDCPGLPADLRDKFATTDECKPVAGGRRVLITSSGGGVALVERGSGEAIFAAFVGNAHSAEMLPGDRIVVAGSTHPRGNMLAVFAIDQPGQPICTKKLHSAHGVVWDDRRQLLWAIGYDELNAYRLASWESASPWLHTACSYPLPDPGGHDLQPARDSDLLVLTTDARVLLFERERRFFVPHATWGDKGRVKCVSIHPRTGLTAIIQAEADHWWSDTVRWLDERDDLKLAGERLYKARWNPAEEK